MTIAQLIDRLQILSDRAGGGDMEVFLPGSGPGGKNPVSGADFTATVRGEDAILIR